MVDWSLLLYSWVSFEWFCCASCVLTLRGFCTIGCLHLYSVLPYGSLTLILSVGYPFTPVPLCDHNGLYCLGRVLNRFSKDVGFLDDLLPFIFVQYTVVRTYTHCMFIPCYTVYHTSLMQLLLRCLAIIITAAAANPYIVIAAVFLIVAFLSVRWYYLKTSRDVKRLEAICEYVSIMQFQLD